MIPQARFSFVHLKPVISMAVSRRAWLTTVGRTSIWLILLAYAGVLAPVTLCAQRAITGDAPAAAARLALDPQSVRPRLAVLTDIGGDPDDEQSMIRLLMYANEFDLEILMATSVRKKHAKLGPTVRPQAIQRLVTAYGHVLPNLQRHASGWPTVDELEARIVSGNPRYGREFIGDGQDSEGSGLLIARIDAGTPERPLNIALWGGQTDLAQALWRVRKDRGHAGYAAFARKFRVFDVADQDGIADWMAEEFPGLFYILSKPRVYGERRQEGTYRGMYVTGDITTTTLEWVEKNIRQSGPLGALYPLKTWTEPNPNGCFKEGDTFSFLFFLPRGHNNPEDPTQPGWGGQYRQMPNGWYGDLDAAEGLDPRLTVSRWRPEFQADFAWRLTWCRSDTPVETSPR